MCVSVVQAESRVINTRAFRENIQDLFLQPCSQRGGWEESVCSHACVHAERRTLSRMLTILDNDHHPLHSTLKRQKSTFSGRLPTLSCSSDRLRKSFVPRAIQIFNATQKGRETDLSA